MMMTLKPIADNYRDCLIAQNKQGLYNESFSHPDRDKRDDGLQNRNEFWPNFVVNDGGPKPNTLYD